MDILERHFQSEQGCDPELLRIKREKMARGRFSFYRGSALVFYQLWSRQKIPASPTVWICGDAHWENVGSYRGKNHIAYFDFTDFDHACLAPAGFDLGRALAGLYLVGKPALAPIFLSAYRRELKGGKPYHIEAEVARGTVARLLGAVDRRSQHKFIRRRSEDGKILLREGETYRLPAAEKRKAKLSFRRWARTMKNPAFFELLDICGSYAGLGALGHRRYLALVRGQSAPHLIDMKEGTPSAAAACAATVQPAWSNEAERVANAQRMVQYVPIARLGWTRGAGASFVLSEFQPAEDRVDSLQLSKKEYKDFASQWGKLLAWAHLRGGGWNGGATTSDLIAFAAKLDGRQRLRLLSAARRTAAHYQKLFVEFRRVTGA